MRANSVAFSIFIALFPILICFFTLVPMVYSTNNLLAVIDNSLQDFLPSDAHEYLFNIIYGILAIKREGLLSLGFILALFFGSSGMLTLMYGFDKSYESTFKRRSWLKARMVAILLTMLLAFLMFFAIVMVVLGEQFLSMTISNLELSAFSGEIFNIFRWFAVALLIYVIVSFIYKYGPSMYRRTGFFNPGAYLATLLIIVASLLFSYFINNFGRYNELYGSIGALIVLMIWLEMVALILLLGFELNASIAVNKDRSLKIKD